MRLSGNVEALMSDIEQRTLRDSLNVATIRVLSLKISDLQRLRGKDALLIRDLGIKLNRVQSLSKNSTHTQYLISAPLSSPQSFPPSPAQQKFGYKTPYIDIQGILTADSVRLELESYDTLIQVAHRIARKFLFIKYGTKHLRQEIFSTNPHTRITYSEFIEVIK